MFQRIQYVFIAALIVIATCGASFAQDRWVKVGSKVIDVALEADGIPLPAPVDAKAVRLQASGGDIKLAAVTVAFGRGLVHTEERPIDLKRGERTRPIEIAPTAQLVVAVDLILEPAQGTGKTTVEVWALTTATAAAPVAVKPTPATPSAAPPSTTPTALPEMARVPGTGEVRIGKAGFGKLGFDDSAVKVGRNAGLRTITLEAKERAITLDSVKVTYMDGTTDRVSVRERLDTGQKKQIAIPTAKPVSDIAINARSRIFDSTAKGAGAGNIEITGRTLEAIAVTPTAATPTSATVPHAPVDTAYPKKRGISEQEGGSLEAMEGGLDACVKAKTCTAVPVFFGTDREQITVQERVSFGADRARLLQLGRVYVTVPRANRETGELNLPSSWSSWLPWSSGTDATRHFTIPKSGIDVFGSDDEFIAAVKAHIASGRGTLKDHAFVYIHGYRVPWEFAAMRTAQIAYDLSPDDAPFGTAFFYSWPSGGATKDYEYDSESSRLAVPYLKSFLKLVAERTGATNVHVIAHSMGNFPLMHALAQISAEAPGIKFNQVILAAPDVDKGEFETIATGIAKSAKGVTLYASSSDNALLLSRLGRRNTPRAGDVKVPPGPAIVAGIDTVDISRLSTGFMSYLSWNHDKYADSPVLLNDISTLFRKGDRPPNQRNLSFRPEPPRADPVKYWRYRE